MLSKIKHSWAGIQECILLPTLAIALPWRVFWRILQARAARESCYHAAANSAMAVAASSGFVADKASWRKRYCLSRLVDVVDAPLSVARNDQGQKDHVIATGHIPPSPCLVVGFHYGTGFWVLRLLRGLGHRVSFLSRPLDPRVWANSTLLKLCAQLRMKITAHAGGGPVIYLGGSIARIEETFRHGGSVLGLIDVPPEGNGRRQVVQFLSQSALFPVGLLEAADRCRVPILTYVARIDPLSGNRILDFEEVPTTEEHKLGWIIGRLERAIRADPASWHLWSEWYRFLLQPGCDAQGMCC
jgi:hypothetical protein